MNKLFFILIILIPFFNSKAQTKTYKMSVNGLLFETLILNEDGTYRRVNEYDIYFERTGFFTISDNKLELINLSGSEVNLYGEIKEKQTFKIKGDEIYFMTPKGRVKKRIKDKSLRKGLSNIFGHKYEYRLIKK